MAVRNETREPSILFISAAQEEIEASAMQQKSFELQIQTDLLAGNGGRWR